MTKRPRSQAHVDCESARALLARFVGGPLPRKEDARLRRHLPDCQDCRSLYMEALSAAARLGHTKREERLETERLRRRATQRRLAFGGSGLSQRTRMHYLRPLLWTALSIFALVGLTRLGETPADDLVWQVGEVRAGAELLGPAHTAARAEAGTWIQTGLDGRATLTGNTGKVVIEQESFLLVESVRPRRVRLQSGACAATGAGLVLTQLGAVEFEDATVRLEQTGASLEVLCLIGHARLVTSRGAFELGPGESKSLRFDLANL